MSFLTIYFIGVLVAFVVCLLDLKINITHYKNNYTNDKLVLLILGNTVISWLGLIVVGTNLIVSIMTNRK